MYSEVGQCLLGASTFFTSSHPPESCGSNGLPLTANSIRVLGQFQWLKTLRHANICQYVDIVRGKQERLMVVQEFHVDSVTSMLKAGRSVDCKRLARDLLSALSYLHQHHLVVRNINTSNVLCSPSGVFKLSQFGMYHMTYQGALVPFPIGTADFLPPEVFPGLLLSPPAASSCRTDVWSVGVVLARAALGVGQCQKNARTSGKGSVSAELRQTVAEILSYDKDADVLEILAEKFDRKNELKRLDADLCDLINQCLTVDLSQRPTAGRLLSHPLFVSLPGSGDWLECFDRWDVEGSRFPLSLSSAELLNNSDDTSTESDCSILWRLQRLSLQQLYHLWQLAGGDVESHLVSQSLVKLKPPILSLPKVISLEGEFLGCDRDSSLLYNDSVVELSLQSLCHRLQDVCISVFFPLLERPRLAPLLHSQSENALSETSHLPLLIKEADIEYQLYRTSLFSRLLQGYPYTASRLREEAAIDIPPLYRAHVWAALLNVTGTPYSSYTAIDKLAPTPADKQIEVDIPRCHQYSDLLSSPVGHQKLQRLAKSWVATQSRYVYWQGLDSLIAPLLYLNFNDEALAFACLSAIIDKYMCNFFLRDNTPVIQECLSVFNQLLAFHDPVLSNHTHDIGFVPDLFAIPWFLTMFTHVFPLHKIFHLWDSLLLRDSSFPLCLGLGVLRRLRHRIEQNGFNECILILSDLPDISMEEVVQDAVRLRSLTPDSVMYRQYAHPPPPPSSGRSVPISQLKSQRCPRIDLGDWVVWSGVGVGGDYRRSRRRQEVVTLDVRPVELYESGHVPGSMHVPEGCDLTSFDLDSWSRRIKVIVDTESCPRAEQVCGELLRMEQARVCVLHGGDSALREAGYFDNKT